MNHDPLLISFFLFLAALVAFALWLAVNYNKLVRLRNRADALWADIDVQLKRRHDLLPNLVEVVSRHATPERGTLEEATLATTRPAPAPPPHPQAAATTRL